jgi:nucleoside-diphosphate-sugar epimerase
MTVVLITGGAGFVGSHLARACLELGWDVSIIYQPGTSLELVEDVLDRAKIYPASDETADVIRVMRLVQPDLVFHLASIFISEHVPADILKLVQSNITFGTQVLEAMAASRVPLIVNAGTSWQHYNDEQYNPVNLYAATKQAFEDILEYFVQAGNMRAITLKLFDTYGPHDPRQKIFHLLSQAADEGTHLEMSPGEQCIDLVYVDDVVAAFLVAARRLLDGKVPGHERYAVTSQKPVSLRTLVEIFERVTGQSLDIGWGGRPYRNREVMKPLSSGEVLPGWKPVVDLPEGIRICRGEAAPS